MGSQIGFQMGSQMCSHMGSQMGSQIGFQLMKPAVLLLSLSLAASMGFAKDSSKSKSSVHPKITMAQARKTALAKQAGKIKSAELETENNRLVYSFDIATKEGIHEVQVDANDGTVVEDKIETAADEAKEKLADKAEKKKLHKTKN